AAAIGPIRPPAPPPPAPPSAAPTAPSPPAPRSSARALSARSRDQSAQPLAHRAGGVLLLDRVLYTARRASTLHSGFTPTAEDRADLARTFHQVRSPRRRGGHSAPRGRDFGERLHPARASWPGHPVPGGREQPKRSSNSYTKGSFRPLQGA